MWLKALVVRTASFYNSFQNHYKTLFSSLWRHPVFLLKLFWSFEAGNMSVTTYMIFARVIYEFPLTWLKFLKTVIVAKTAFQWGNLKEDSLCSKESKEGKQEEEKSRSN